MLLSPDIPAPPVQTRPSERIFRPEIVRSARLPGLRWLPLGYAALLIITRLLASESLEHDEAEQVLFSQRLEWGYSLQPPLYTWIVWLSVRVFGLNLFALAAVKSALLLVMFTVLGRLLRRLDVPEQAATVAGMTLLFSHFFAWNLSLNITHTALSTMVIVVMLLHAVRLMERPTALGYAVLGTLAALGLLAKYNFAVFAGALLLAGLTLPAGRRVLLDVRMLIAGAVGLVVLTPHLHWLLENWDGVFAALEKKTGLDDEATGLWRVGRGLWTLIEHALVLLVPFLIATGLCLGRAGAVVWKPRDGDRPVLQLFERTAWALCVVMAVVVIAGVNRMTAGWLAPGLVLAPLVVFGRLAAAGWPAFVHRRLGWAIVLVVCVTAAIKVGVYGAWHGRNLGRDLLFAEAARALEREGGQYRVFLADNLLTAGNLRFASPGVAVASLDMPLFRIADAEPEAFIWNDSKKLVRAVREHLAGLGVNDAATSPGVTRIAVPVDGLHPNFRRLGLLQTGRQGGAP